MTAKCYLRGPEFNGTEVIAFSRVPCIGERIVVNDHLYTVYDVWHFPAGAQAAEAVIWARPR